MVQERVPNYDFYLFFVVVVVVVIFLLGLLILVVAAFSASMFGSWDSGFVVDW